MEKTFATLSRTFRALAALFPDAAVLHGSKATIYRSSICGMDVTAREVTTG